MRLSQKVFWIFFTAILVTLVLSLNQFVTYFTQQHFNHAVKLINRLQLQVQLLDLQRMELFLPGGEFDQEKFDSLLAASLETSDALSQDIGMLPTELHGQVGGMAFHLRNFRTSLRELAQIRTESLQLKRDIHDLLDWLHSSEHLSLTDLQLVFNVSSLVHHQDYQRLPLIKQYVNQMESEHLPDATLDENMQQLLHLLDRFYLYDLQLVDRKQFVETATGNFVAMAQQMLQALETHNTRRQQLVSKISLGITVCCVLAAIFFWYRIRVYLRSFLFNQKKLMQAIQTDEEELELVSQGNDELGELTTTLKDLSVELREKKADLHASEQKYRLLVESLTDWIWETNVNHRFSYCSRAGEKITGYSQATLLGRKYLELSQECESAAVYSSVEACFRERKPFTNVERRIHCADGTVRHLISSGAPLFDAAGRFVGFRGVDRDVTALVQTRQAHEQLEEHLQHAQKMESVGRLAGGVAHDFNNILSAIIGYAELLIRRLEPEDKSYRYVSEIIRSSDRASALTKQLLAFSRRQAHQPENLNLEQELTALDSMLQRLVTEQISLEVIVEQGTWPVWMDRSQLEQVVINLVVNARDALSEGGRIEVRVQNCPPDSPCREKVNPNLPKEDFVQLSVTDNGSGIPRDVLPNIFDPFFTTKEKGKGTGLGLAMVYGIVSQNNGDIHIETEVGKGSCFNVLVPRSRAAASRQTLPELDQSLRQGKETILFVEDERALLQMHAEFLESLGYQVITASDGVDALQKVAQDEAVDVLITDVVMPNMGGIELASKLSERDPNLTILYSSGYADDELFSEGVLQDGVNFIYKPASPIAVARMLGKLLDNRPQVGY